MPRWIIAVAATLGLGLSDGHAATYAESMDAFVMLSITAMDTTDKTDVCSQRFPTVAPEHRAAFNAWKARNAVMDQFRDEIIRLRKAHEQTISGREVGQKAAQELAQLTTAVQRENQKITRKQCQDFLSNLRRGHLDLQRINAKEIGIICGATACSGQQRRPAGDGLFDDLIPSDGPWTKYQRRESQQRYLTDEEVFGLGASPRQLSNDEAWAAFNPGKPLPLQACNFSMFETWAMAVRRLGREAESLREHVAWLAEEMKWAGVDARNTALPSSDRRAGLLIYSEHKKARQEAVNRFPILEWCIGHAKEKEAAKK